MKMLPALAIALAVVVLLPDSGSVHAQTVGYAEAVDRLAAACGKDIARLCKQVNLGGGRIQQCLN
jgi:hypothetical protein